MYLKRLEIQGFKSFAHKTTMEFEPGITAVVGPNGSGKSNVADSVRWVLGEQSSKMLRGKKSDDVVFAGSDKKVRAGFAEVVATFDNSDRIIPLDAPEVSIGRRIDRTGESEYLINGQKARLMDVVDLVLKSNIGTSRYTVIGQGTIDALIMSGPGEIKGLLDEASGVKVYQLRRERTLKRLEQTAQNLMRVEDVLAEIEPRLKSLRRQAKKMEAREQLETEVRVLLREFWGGQYFTHTKKLHEVQQRINRTTEQKQELRQQQDVLTERKNSLIEKETGLGGKFSQIRTQINDLSYQKNSLLEKKSMLSGKILSLKTGGSVSPEVLASELSQLRDEEVRLEKESSEDRQNILELEAQEKTLEQNLNDLIGKLDRIYLQLASKQPLSQTTASSIVLEVEEAVAELEAGLGKCESIEQAFGIVTEIKKRLFGIRQKFGLAKTAPEAVQTDLKEELTELSSARTKLEQEVKLIVSSRAGRQAGLQVKVKRLGELKQKQLDLELELSKTGAKTHNELALEITGQQQQIDRDLEALTKQIEQYENLLLNFDQEAKERRKGLGEVENSLRDLQSLLDAKQGELTELEVELARIETELRLLEKEIVDFFGPEELESIRQDHTPATTPDLESRIARARSQLEQIGGVDEMTMQEYQETDARFSNLSGQVQDLRKAMEDLRSVLDELDMHIKGKFQTAFHQVNEKFENYFRMLFGGGKASLSILKNQMIPDEKKPESGEVESGDVEADLRPEERLLQQYEQGQDQVLGVDIKATPPGKKLASVQALSGGERALTAIALLCSLLSCFPSPFVVLDEVDAALDESNTIRFGQILGTLAHQTQFLTITHNRETMAQSSTLYGVTMGDDGVSKILSIKFDQATAYAK